MNSSNSNQNTILCVKNCGFFGNPMFGNMCSKCFKENEKMNQENKATDIPVIKEESVPVPEKPTVVATVEAKQPETVEPVVEPVEEKIQRPEQKNKARCFTCNAKLTIAKQISNKCRCEYIFCDSHRVPSKHNCDFDHQQLNKDILEKKNPKITSNKGGSFVKLD
jgi:hypothetical protein